MDDKEIKKQLVEAKKYRNNGYFAEALAILHQINNEFPKNITYHYLLAATYYESMNIEAGKRYAEEVMVLDPNFKENYELLGDIYEKEGKIEDAKDYYEKAYQLDSKYTTVEEKLIQIYLKTKNYEGVVHICDNMMSYIPIDTSSTKSRRLTSIYFGCVLYKGWALVYLKRYEEAIQEILRRKELNYQTKMPSFPHQYKDDDEALFKMYYQLKNVQKTEEYRKALKMEYNLMDDEILKLEEEAQKDIILFRQRPEVMGYLGLS
ncbi:MAG: tetratricopeptide repeat protein [Flavobacteriales bacterium]